MNKLFELRNCLALMLMVAIIVIGTACGDTGNDDIVDNNKTTEVKVEETTTEVPKWYDGIISETLANEIQNALNEIKEEREIIEIKIEEERETDLFIRRVYIVSTKKTDYKAYTYEWYESEPEYQEHPYEYLYAIGGEGLNNIYWDLDGAGNKQ